MAVYVDSARIPYGRMKMSHMIADSTDELVRMARALSLQDQWIQHPGDWNEHYDISISKRAEAIRQGAQEVTSKQLVTILQERRGSGLRCDVCRQVLATKASLSTHKWLLHRIRT